MLSTMMNWASLLSLPHAFNCTRSCCSWGPLNFTSISNTIIGSCWPDRVATHFSAPVRTEEAIVPCGMETLVDGLDLESPILYANLSKPPSLLVMSALLILAINMGLFSLGLLMAICTAVVFPDPWGPYTIIVGKCWLDWVSIFVGFARHLPGERSSQGCFQVLSLKWPLLFFWL